MRLLCLLAVACLARASPFFTPNDQTVDSVLDDRWLNRRAVNVSNHPSGIDPNNQTAMCERTDYYDPQCWDILNVTEYLRDWRSSVHDCKDVHLNNDQCCSPPNLTETWSACYIRLATSSIEKRTFFNCDNITSATCDLSNATARPDLAQKPQIQYVLRALYACGLVSQCFMYVSTCTDKANNWLYTSWYLALYDAMSKSALQAPGITKFLDPIRNVHATLDLIMAIVMVSLAVVAGSEFIGVAAGVAASSKAALKSAKKLTKQLQEAKAAGKDVNAEAIAQALQYSSTRVRTDGPNAPEVPNGPPSIEDQIAAATRASKMANIKGQSAAAANGITLTAMVDAPFLARAIWPAYTADSQLIQIGGLLDDLSTIVDNVRTRLQDANKVTMSDFDTFVNATQHGRFAQNDLPTVQNGSDFLLLGLKTYLFTTALAHNGFNAHYGPLSGDGIEFTPESAAVNFGCTVNASTKACNVEKKGRQGQPAGWMTFASNVTQNFYSIGKLDKNGIIEKKPPSPQDVINMALSNGWTTMDMLFDASFICSQRRNLNQLLVGALALNATNPINDTTPAISIAKRDDDTQIGYNDGFDFTCLSQLDIIDGCSHDKIGSQTRWGIARTTPEKCTVFFNL